MNTSQITIDNSSLKRERLEFRIPQKLKILFQHAADIQGKSLSDFLVTTAEKTANEVIRENQVIQLSIEDSIAFAKALLHAPKPNKTLQSAYTRYKKNVISQ